MSQYEADDDGADGIIHPIDQPLEIGDFIEIQGISRGGIVLIELLAEAVAPNDATEVLPLQLTLMTGGPMSILSRNHKRLERNECFMKYGLQNNLQFELSIFVKETEFEIRLNKENVAFQKHVIPPGEIRAIGMYGNAEFTSIEFKDVNGDDDMSDSINPPSGFVRVQELRESQQRKRGSPLLVRTSTRRSFKDIKDQWKTSADLTKPDLDIDQPVLPAERSATIHAQVPSANLVNNQSYTDSIREDLNSSKRSKGLKLGGSRRSVNLNENKFDENYVIGGAQSNVLAGYINRGSYHRVDDERIGSIATAESALSIHNQSSKRSSLFSLKKSKGSETDLKESTRDSKTKRSSIFGRHKKASETDLRAASSLPNLKPDSYSATELRAHHMENPLYLGVASDRAPMFGELPKSVSKESAPEIAAYVAAQKAVPEFEDFTMTTESDRLFIGNWVQKGPLVTDSPFLDEKERKLDGPAPLIADVLYEKQRGSAFDPEPTLTGKSSGIDIDSYIVGAEKQNLNRNAPEIVAAWNPNEKSKRTSELSTTGIKPRVVAKPENVKGTAPEMASAFDEYFKYTNKYSSQSDITGLDKPSQSAVIVREPKIATEVVMQKSNTQHAGRPISVESYSRERKIETDLVILESPTQHSRRPLSGESNSGESTVYTDNEYYLDVGTSGYYMERKRSLKTYQSRKTRKKDKAARKSMGFDDTDDSSSDSSISALKPDDPTIIPNPKRKQPGSDISKVNYWLEEGSKETKVYPVHATAPTHAEIPTPGLKMDALQLRQGLFSADLPVPMGPGRMAQLSGHFLETSTEPQSCRIQLSTESDSLISAKMSTNYVVFVIEVWSDGRMNVSGVKIDGQWDLKSGAKSRGSDTFNLKFYIHQSILLVTLDDMLTLKLEDLNRSTYIKNVTLEDCNNAELDNLTVSSTLMLPLDLFYPESVQNSDTQSLTLRTKLTADCKDLKLQFTTKTIAIEESFDVVFDFDEYILRVENEGVCVEAGKHATIPFVPEQIKQIRIETRQDGSAVTIFVNQHELLCQNLPFKLLCVAPDRVHINGELVLLEAKFD